MDVYHNYHEDCAFSLDPYFFEQFIEFEQVELVRAVDFDSEVGTEKEVVETGQQQCTGKDSTTQEP